MIKLFGEIHKWYKYHFSTPLWVYIMVLAIAIIFISVTLTQPESVLLNRVLSNCGYGILASAIFAALVDCGNKNRKNEKKSEVRAILTYELRHEFLKLRETVQSVVENRCGSSDEKLTFSEWLDEAFCKKDDTTEDEYWNGILEIIVCVNFIYKVSTALLEHALVVIDYLDDPKELIAKVKTVAAVSSLIDNSFDKEEYDKLAHKIGKILVPEFLKIAPGYTDYFQQPYNCNLEEY